MNQNIWLTTYVYMYRAEDGFKNDLLLKLNIYSTLMSISCATNRELNTCENNFLFKIIT